MPRPSVNSLVVSRLARKIRIRFLRHCETSLALRPTAARRALPERKSPAMPSNTTDSISPAAVSTPAAAAHPAGAALLLGALGVVFGDIGTSPIYAFRETLRAAGADAEAVATPTSTA